MIPQDEITVLDSGSGYAIGEIPKQHHKLGYLKPGALVCLFDGVDTMLDYITEKMATPKQDQSSANTGGGLGSFNAFKTYDEALGIFRGEPQSVVNFDPSELRIKDANEAGSQVDYDVTGDFIDMGRYMEGIPETVGSMRNGNARNRRVNILINLSQIHYINHKDITHRSERTLRLVDALEAGGVRTMLTGVESNECGHTEVILKHHEEPLTIADLAVATHPEFLRRMIFRINEYSKTWDDGYGSAIKFSQLITPQMVDTANNDELDIVIDSNMQGKDTINKVFDQLERLIVWEMSKPVPEVSSIKLDKNGIYFEANGSRGEAEIQREGKEAIRGE